MDILVKVKKLYEDSILPTIATKGSAGSDLYAYVPQGRLVIPSGGTVLVKTGIAVEVPIGIEMQIRARSGLALRYGIMLANGIGTVDSDFRGEVGVILHNAGNNPFAIHHGTRIAQAVFARYDYPVMISVKELSETARGENGFGSTGK